MNASGRSFRQPKVLTPPSTARALLDIASRLSRGRIVWMAVGALPVNYYGRPRLSEDIDLAVILEEGQEATLFRILKEPRYKVLYPDKATSRDDPELRSPRDLKEINLVKMRDSVTGTLIDLLIRPSAYGLAQESFKRRRKVKLGGKVISIASPEDYILMKLVSRRPATEDFQDMFTTMVKNFRTLDWAYLETRARELNISHLLSEYKGRAGAVVGGTASSRT